MLEDQKSEKLIQLISDCTGIESALLVDNCSVCHDFGVAGDDGFELLEAISNEFEIDMSHVDSWRYFGPEGAYNPFYHLYCFVRGKKLDHNIVRLEISDLKSTVEAGIWQEPNG
ncbi:hypothetical protein [Ruegeria jejuensis]|uniref:hypothetical protein n=1 Tax=Ruegeria jejuensis TaxID=3233338 RepID=UPI00355B2B98